MNTERMLYLAEQLENPTDPKLKQISFHMDNYSNPAEGVNEAINCGTVACVGGHACILFGERNSQISELNAQKLLGLRWGQVDRLFYNFDLTRRTAAEELRRMVEEEQEALEE